jgi:hypothetical protein
LTAKVLALSAHPFSDIFTEWNFRGFNVCAVVRRAMSVPEGFVVNGIDVAGCDIVATPLIEKSC